MKELNNLIQKHVINYPAVELADILKLIYQNEFGPGHMVTYGEEVYSRILKEIVECKAISRPGTLAESIGNGLARVHCVLFVGLFKDKLLAARVLASLFSVTADIHKGEFFSFADKLDVLLNLIKNEELSGNDEYMFKDWIYNYKETRTEIDKYIASGHPAPGHSDDFRRIYSPCYRVVSQEFMSYVELFKLLEQPLAFGRRVVLAIDGRSGAGKTTLAKIVANVYGGNVISMDDFYLPLILRTTKRMKEPGGHIHFERFIEQVLNPIKAGQTSITYEKYNCQTGESTTRIAELSDKVIVVEGSYSMHPWIRDLFTHTVYMDINDTKQKNRLIRRNGKEGYELLKKNWIPPENKYRRTYSVDGYCNLLF